MKISYLKEFLILAETCNYLEASDQLFISQSTLSRHMQNLENELGAMLFERTTRRVKLSDSGRLIRPYAEEFVRIENECMDAFANKLRQMKAALTIGSIPTMSQYNITTLLTSFQKENPNLTMDILEADSNELAHMVQEGTCDFAFMREMETEHENLNVLLYTEDRLAAILPVNHPLAQETSVCLEQLKADKFFLLPEDSMMYKLCVNACKELGFLPSIAYTSHHGRNIVNLVGKGAGISVLSRRSAAHYATPLVSIVDIEPTITTQINLVYQKKRQLTIAGNCFLRYVKKSISSK